MTDGHTDMLRQMDADAKLTEPKGDIAMCTNDKCWQVEALYERVETLEDKSEAQESQQIYIARYDELARASDKLMAENKRLREEVASLGVQFSNMSEHHDRRTRKNIELVEEVKHVRGKMAEWKLLAEAKMKTIEELQEVLRK